jgi:signal transduction histidine kinase
MDALGTDLPKTGSFKFSVDAALLRELGERLVGQAHVALGELIKNSYDADARRCEIAFNEDGIVLTDNGHGMNPAEFESFWMRVGTTHKAAQAFSRELKRPLTGSKGVGRLAVQFLAKKLKLETRAKGSDRLLTVVVDWPEAVRAGDLIEAKAHYEIEESTTKTFAGGKPYGTRIFLSELNHSWDEETLKSVAREVWELVPPYEEDGWSDPNSFSVGVKAADKELEAGFSDQLKAALRQWIAQIEGSIEGGRDNAVERITVTFKDGESFSEEFALPGCMLEKATWNIKVYNLRGRLAEGVRVQEARDYLEEYGGVHVYDGAFRLPYYGVRQDWLDLEFDHSHRRSKSSLLPDELHVQRALNDLPTQGRLFGTVRINTGLEQRRAPKDGGAAAPHLQIQVTRDRLVANESFLQLKDAVRRSIDYYATRSMMRRLREAKESKPATSSADRVVRLSTVLDSFQSVIPEEAFQELHTEVAAFVETTRRERGYLEAIQQLLGPLATAGIAAIALEHEANRELLVLGDLAKGIRGKRAKDVSPEEIATRLEAWISKYQDTRRVFAPLMSEDDRDPAHRLLVSRVVERVVAATRVFTEGVYITTTIPGDLRFPEGSLADWNALLQNILVNATNAMVDVQGAKEIWITAKSGSKKWLRVSDTGKGVDLKEAASLFDPFLRRTPLRRRANPLGLGGLGLGLTIVRMIAENRNCTVAFVEPEPGFATTFEITWS